MHSKTIFSANSIINFLLNFLRVIFLLSAFALVIIGLFSLMELLTGATPMSGRYPVFFSYLNDGIIKTSDGEGMAVIGMHRGLVDVSSANLSHGFVLFRVLMGMAMQLSFLMSVYLTIQILESVEGGEYFAIDNAVRLRWVAILSILITILDRFMKVGSSIYFENKLEFSRLSFDNIPFFQLEDIKFVIIFLFLLVIAEAFRAGALLKEENDLTI